MEASSAESTPKKKGTAAAIFKCVGIFIAAIAAIPVSLLLLFLLLLAGIRATDILTAPTEASLSRFAARNMELLNQTAVDIALLGENVLQFAVMKDSFSDIRTAQGDLLQMGDMYVLRVVENEGVYEHIESPAIRRILQTFRVESIRCYADGSFELRCGDLYHPGKHYKNYYIQYFPEGSDFLDSNPEIYVRHENGWRYNWRGEGMRWIAPITGNWFFVEETWPP